MTRDAALAQAESLGYTIKYRESPTQLELRKPGAAVTAMNEPYEYCLVERKSGRWSAKELVRTKII